MARDSDNVGTTEHAREGHLIEMNLRHPHRAGFSLPLELVIASMKIEERRTRWGL